jgi:amidase
MTYSTAMEQVEALRTRKVSAAELLDQAVRRIELHDPKVNAIIVRDFDRAQADARAADIALSGGDRRPLLGLPMTVKEAFNVAGLPTTWGLPGTMDIPVTADAVVVERLRAAGAIIIGKSNVAAMLADWQSANPVYGATRNPWDLDRTPGGSSGGGAAALAAGFVALEFGSDLASSLRAPAAFCGVYAHKPTFGVVPNRGFAPPGTPDLITMPLVDMAVVGPMARSAQDLALALEVVAGADVRDAMGWRLVLPPARHERLGAFRVLVLTDHPRVPTAASIRAALSDRAEALEAAGCFVSRESRHLPDLGAVTDTFSELLSASFAADAPNSAARHADWIRADRRRAAISDQWRALYEDFDVVLCPAMPTTAPPLNPSSGPPATIQVDEQSVPYGAQPVWGALATLTGGPATAVPMGLDAAGLPIGAQVLGPYLEDRTTIAFAAAMEAEFGGFRIPADWS